MKITILIDNNSNNELLKEWGLSIFIENNDKKYLLDSGSSNNFIQNAKSLGIKLSDVDYGILSHAHYDHSNGIKGFFDINQKASFLLQETTKENCYHHVWWKINKYIGIKKGWLKRYSKRFSYVPEKYEIEKGVFLLSHFTKGLEEKGKKAKLYIKENGKIVPDSFKHEQSLIFQTKKGLVIFNSCSHGGADNIIKEVQQTFENQKIYAIIGGFHLFCLDDESVRAFAKRVNNTGIEKVITGHCTGDRAFEILKEELKEKVEKMYSGMQIEI